MRGSLAYRHTIGAGALGYITQAVVNNLAPLLFLIFSDSLGISLEQITWLITVNFLIQLTVDFLAARYADRIGYRICMVAAHLLSAAGLAGMAVLPMLLPSPFAGLVLSVAVYAVGGGILEVLVSPIVEACPTRRKAAVMSLLHSFYCWGTVAVVFLSTLFLHLFGKGSWHALCLLWTLLPLLNAVLFTRVPIARLTKNGDEMRARALFAHRDFWLLFLLMIASGASEQAMSQWASAFAESGLHVSKALGDLLGPCLFSVCMGCARLMYARCGDRIELSFLLILSGALCACAYLISALSPWPFLSLMACGLCGLSVGVLWPGVFSIASARFPRGGTALFACLALAGDMGCASGPACVGAAAQLQNNSLSTGLLFAMVFPMMLLICTAAYRSRR